MTGIFFSDRCPCGAVGVPPTSPYCEKCLGRLSVAVTDVLGGEVDA